MQRRQLLGFLSATRTADGTVFLDRARRTGKLPSTAGFVASVRRRQPALPGGYHRLRWGVDPELREAALIVPKECANPAPLLVAMTPDHALADEVWLRRLFQPFLARGRVVLVPGARGVALEGDPVGGLLAALKLRLDLDEDRLLLLDRIDRTVAEDWQDPRRVDPTPFAGMAALLSASSSPLPLSWARLWAGRSFVLSLSTHPAEASRLLVRRLQLAGHQGRLDFVTWRSAGLDWSSRVRLDGLEDVVAPLRRGAAPSQLDLVSGGSRPEGREWLRLPEPPSREMRLLARASSERIQITTPEAPGSRQLAVDLYLETPPSRLVVSWNGRRLHDGPVPSVVDGSEASWWLLRHRLQTGRRARALLRLRP